MPDAQGRTIRQKLVELGLAPPAGYYDHDAAVHAALDRLVGFSIPAVEHAAITSWEVPASSGPCTLAYPLTVELDYVDYTPGDGAPSRLEMLYYPTAAMRKLAQERLERALEMNAIAHIVRAFPAEFPVVLPAMRMADFGDPDSARKLGLQMYLEQYGPVDEETLTPTEDTPCP